MNRLIANEDFIVKNYNKTIELLQLAQLPELERLIAKYSDRYSTAPASTNEEYYSAFPGGLCYHNLQTVNGLMKLSQALCPNKFQRSSLVKVGFLAELGKIGDASKDYFIPVDSDWHNKKGIYYEYNKELSFMRIVHRSLFFAQVNGVEVSEEEYLAILAIDQAGENNSPYAYRENDLGFLLQTAIRWSQKQAKENKVIWAKSPA